MDRPIKIIRSSTISTSLDTFCKGQLAMLRDMGYEVVAVSTPDDRLEAMARREGIRAVGVPMQRHISVRDDIRSLWLMYRLFRREKPYLVHSMTPKAGLICMMAAFMARVPKRVHTFTGLIWPTTTGLKRMILMTTDRILCFCATHIIPEGQGVLNDLRNYGITSKQMRILGYGNVRGIDPAYYDRTPEVMAEAEKVRDKDAFTYVFIGRIVADKGIHELIDAFIRVHKQHPDTRLLLVGGLEPELDPLRPETIATIDDCPDIISIGRVGDVRPYLAAADCLVFPSYREGFPNVVLEAGAMGLPAIVTDINGSREIIEDAFNGCVISPHDTDALAEAMSAFAENPEKTARMASVARQHVLSRWSRTIVNEALLSFYGEILPKP